MGDPMVGRDCPWRSVEGGRGGCLPRGHRLLPRQLLALEALGSVWKAVLKELEGKVVDQVCFRDGLGPALPLRTAWVWLAPWLPGGPRAGVSGVAPSTAPTQVWKDGEEGWGFKDRIWHLLASWKADPQGHPALVLLTPEGS